jgi:hypothetical protein
MATASSGLTALLGVLTKISPCPNPDCELPKISPCPNPDCELNLPWMAAPMATATSGLTALLGVLPKISPCPNPDCELPKISPCPNPDCELPKISPCPNPDCELPKNSPCPDPDCELTLDGGAHGDSLVRIDGLARRLAEDLLASLLDLGHPGHTTHQQDLPDVRLGHLGVLHGL